MSERRLSPEVIAGILEDYRSGILTRDIAERHNVSTASVNKAARRAGLHRPKPKSERTWGPCEVCGKRCRGFVRMRCRLHSQQRGETADEPVALTGGRWVGKNGIQVWQADPEFAPQPRESLEDRRSKTAQCGTDSGYHRHIKVTKTPACDLCKEAHRVAQRESAAVKARQQRGSAA